MEPECLGNRNFTSLIGVAFKALLPAGGLTAGVPRLSTIML